MDAVTGRSAWIAALCTGGAMSLALPVGAQTGAEPRAATGVGEPDAAPAPPSEARSIHFEFRFQGDLGFNANLDGSPGDLTITRAGAGVTSEIPAGDRGTLYLGYDYALTNYDFSGATGLIPGTSDPWGSVQSHGVNAMFLHRATEEVTWLVGGDLMWTAEQGAAYGDAMTGLVYGSVTYAVRPGVTLGLGGGLRSRLEDSAIFVPLVSLDWAISDEWRLRTTGPGLAIEYTPDDRWKFSLSGRYDLQDFRLDENGPAPGGVGRDERVPISLGVEFTPTRAVTVSARAGVHLFANLEALDASGNPLGETDANPSPFVTLWCKVRF